MRYLTLISALLVVGCDLPTHLFKQVITVIADQDYSTIPAYHIGKLIVFREMTPTPDPAPDIKIGDTCPHCKGTGREPGDGTVNIPCGQCKGDGVVDEGDPILVDTEDSFDISNNAIANNLNEKSLLVAEEYAERAINYLDKTIKTAQTKIIESSPTNLIIKLPNITVDIEGMIYTYDNLTGHFISPDMSEVLDMDPIPANEINGIKSIQLCTKEDGVCKLFDLIKE